MGGSTDDRIDARRLAAITLASRIRIALPYRRATAADLDAVDAALGELRAAAVPEDDDVFTELANLRDTLEILAT